MKQITLEGNVYYVLDPQERRSRELQRFATTKIKKTRAVLLEILERKRLFLKKCAPHPHQKRESFHHLSLKNGVLGGSPPDPNPLLSRVAGSLQLSAARCKLRAAFRHLLPPPRSLGKLSRLSPKPAHSFLARAS